MAGPLARIGSLTGFVLLLGGCVSDGYTSPEGITSQSGAEVVGSKENHASALFGGELRAYLSEIDGKATFFGPNEWDRSKLLAPGRHEVQVAVWKLGSDIGHTQKETITVAAGKTYTLRTDDLTVDDNGLSTLVWLQADDGSSVGDKATVLLEPARGKCD